MSEMLSLQTYWEDKAGVFAKRGLCPLPKTTALTKTTNMTNGHCVHENKGFAPQTPENDENDRNGGCHARKDPVCQKPGFRTPERKDPLFGALNVHFANVHLFLELPEAVRTRVVFSDDFIERVSIHWPPQKGYEGTFQVDNKGTSNTPQSKNYHPTKDFTNFECQATPEITENHSPEVFFSGSRKPCCCLILVR